MYRAVKDGQAELRAGVRVRVGVKHLENCPVEPYIPIYLLVGGCFGLLKVLSMLWMQVRYRPVHAYDADATQLSATVGDNRVASAS